MRTSSPALRTTSAGTATRPAYRGTAALVLLGLPCALGYNVWGFIQPMGAGSTVLDFEDFLVSNLLLPGGSLVYLLFCVTKWGWGFDKYAAECNTGERPQDAPAGSSRTLAICAAGADRGDFGARRARLKRLAAACPKEQLSFGKRK
ncbi:hypothetical protein [Gemmiger formicilis]|uniref:hypothetical protein n=1 Tax=Gemmiger formicilis TaxID=745368 RepID=UPI0039910EC5